MMDSAVDDDQAVRARHIRAAAEGVAHHGEKAQTGTEPRRRSRWSGARRTFLRNRLAKIRRANFMRRLPPATCCRFAGFHQHAFFQMQHGVGARATTGSCVTISTVLLVFLHQLSIKAMISSALLRSRSPVGSSHSRKVGSETIARAMVTRCSCPPESCRG